MKKVLFLIFAYILVSALTGCYATLRADKVFYHGNMFRSPQQAFIDSNFQSGVWKADSIIVTKE